MMRIAFVTNNYTPYRGGLVSSLQSFAQELRAQGHEVVIVTLHFCGTQQREDGVVRLCCPVRMQCGVYHLAVPWYPTQQLEQVLRSFAVDVVHVHHPFLLGPAGVRAARRLDVPVIFTYHTRYEQFAYHLPLPRAVAQRAILYKVWQFCPTVDHIIAPSESVRNFVQTHAGRTLPISVVPSGILPVYRNTTKPPKQPLAGRKIKLLTVSRFAKEKNIPLLLRAMRQLRADNFHLTIAGYGPEYHALRSLAYDECGLSEQHVSFACEPSRQQIAQLYRDADLFLFASVGEGQGLVLAEAMAAGTPAIATDVSGSCDIVRSGQNGFLARDEFEMVARVREAVADQIRYNALSAGAWQTGKRYLPNVCAEQLEVVYRRVCG